MQTGLRRGLSKLSLDLQRVGLYAAIGDPLYYAKTYYFATDDPVPNTGTLYYSDGTSWTMVSTTKGELARATITANGPTTTSTTISDVVGLSISFTLATARAVTLKCTAYAQNTAASYLTGYITDSGNTQKASSSMISTSAGSAYKLPAFETTLDLTAGSYTYKVRQQAPVTGTVNFYATLLDPAFLQALLL